MKHSSKEKPLIELQIKKLVLQKDIESEFIYHLIPKSVQQVIQDELNDISHSHIIIFLYLGSNAIFINSLTW